MKTKDEKEKFIELRASGLSFDKIASMLNISKPVLISWSVEFQKEIKNLEYFRYQAILVINSSEFLIPTKLLSFNTLISVTSSIE